MDCALAHEQMEEWARARCHKHKTAHTSSHSSNTVAAPASLVIPASLPVDLRATDGSAPSALKEWVAAALHQSAFDLRLRPIAAVMSATHEADGQ